jgi:hypothetical protein
VSDGPDFSLPNFFQGFIPAFVAGRLPFYILKFLVPLCSFTMVSLSSSFILLSLALSVLSVPVPNPQDAFASVSVPGAPAPSATAAPTDETEPITFGELTTPSEGGTFNDFNFSPADAPSEKCTFSPRTQHDHLFSPARLALRISSCTRNSAVQV